MINMKIKKDCLMKHKIFLLVQGLLFTGMGRISKRFFEGWQK
nr:MAG TPA: hypothetical protein [Caudoviricetes sp.]